MIDVGMKQEISRVLQRIGLMPYARWAQYTLRSLGNEAREERAHRSHFYAQFVKPGDLCFDVGANMGNRIEAFLSVGARVIAVEPQKQCANYLKLRYRNRIELVEAALGEAPGESEIFISNASTLSSMSPDWISKMKSGRFSNYEWSKKQKVQVTTLDALISRYGTPQFCKVDVEGFELEVLKGLHEPIPCLSFEFAVPEAFSDAEACLKLLESRFRLECNYSLGESMQLSLKDWCSVTQLVDILQGLPADGKSFGDVYVRCHKK